MGQNLARYFNPEPETGEWPEHRAPQALEGLDYSTPPSFVMDPEHCKLGVHLRNLILYQFVHAAKTFEGWQETYADIKHQHVGPDIWARNQFWSNQKKMRKEMVFFDALERDVQWTCNALAELQYASNMATTHLNLAARSEYLLRLCVSALTDLRMADEETCLLTCHKPATIHIVTDNLGYNSGLNNSKPFVSHLTMSAPYQYGGDREPKLKLPTHFLWLLDKLYGGAWTLKPRLFMHLLVRYMLFLTFIIWMPRLYDDEVGRTWRCPNQILYLEYAPCDGDTNEMETSMVAHPWLVAPNNTITDNQVIRQTDDNPDWDDNMDGVQCGDNDSLPLRRHVWESFVAHDKRVDTSTCLQTSLGLFSRVIR